MTGKSIPMHSWLLSCYGCLIIYIDEQIPTDLLCHSDAILRAVRELTTSQYSLIPLVLESLLLKTFLSAG